MTGARFAALHGLLFGPPPLDHARSLLKLRARHERHRHSAAFAAGFRLRLGGGVPLRLRFARRFSPPALHFSARRPQTEAFAIRPKVVGSFGLPTTEGASSAHTSPRWDNDTPGSTGNRLVAIKNCKRADQHLPRRDQRTLCYASRAFGRTLPPFDPACSAVQPVRSSRAALARCRNSAGFRLWLGGGVALWLSFATRSALPVLHFPARRPQTEATVWINTAVARPGPQSAALLQSTTVPQTGFTATEPLDTRQTPVSGRV